MLIYPDYYKDFHCIAGACRHSCCIGWEIDVDESSLARFLAEEGPLGDKLRANIAQEDGCAHFILGEEERCPFLQADGLCEIILQRGEGALCQICADHPRFRNFFTGRTEIGLGLCCEAAAELILSRQEPVRLIEEGDCPDLPEDEQALLTLRTRLIALAQDRSQPMEARLGQLLALSGLTSPADWVGALLSLERLDESWTRLLESVPAVLPEAPADWEIPLEQLLCYFLYRHLPGALEDDDVPGRMALCAFATRCVRDAALSAGIPLAEAARMFSAEVEYSEENIGALLDSML